MSRLSEDSLTAIDYETRYGEWFESPVEPEDVAELVRGYREFREVLEAWRDAMTAQSGDELLEFGACLQCYGPDDDGDHDARCLVARTIAVLAGGAE